MSLLKIVTKSVSKLSPYKGNARTHSEKQVAQIAASIKEFGWTNPVLIDEAGEVIAGHGRLEACKVLKRKSVPCIVLKGLSTAQKRAYRLADNKIPLNSGWDEDLLRIEMKGIDASLAESIGLVFDDFDLDFDPSSVAPANVDDQGKLDERKPITCPACAHVFAP